MNILMQHLSPYMQNARCFQDALNNYSHRRTPTIREILHKGLSIEERHVLLELFFYKNSGWFVYQDGIGRQLLRAAAMKMGLTNTIVKCDNPRKHSDFIEFIENITESFGTMLCCSYAKQKAATLTALSKIREKNPTVNLYRGVNLNDVDSYQPNCLESYTTSLKIAQRFAGSGGSVLHRIVPIEQIFAYKTTIYKTKNCPSLAIRTMISKEKEYIVESKEECLHLEWDKTCNLYKCR